MTKQQLAAELYAALILKKRNSDCDDAFYSLVDNAPAWMLDAVRAAHDNGEELPNDWRYAFIQKAANTLAENHDWENLPYPEAEVFNHDLIKWLGEFPNAAWYCDQVAEDLPASAFPNLFTRISAGNAYANYETLEAVRTFIENLAEQNAGE